ncbi:MAG: alpha/beta hydrolase [Bacteroidia bacterium]|nr:alpha/beta hydrolase [Bacteroidia bacterium]
MLLHGFPENLHIWDEFASGIAKNFRVITIDLPGFGQSECIGYVHTMELMAQCVREVMRALKLRRYVLAGHSMGGYAGLALAELYGENLSGLCLFHSSSYADSEAKKAERGRSIEAVRKHPAQYLKSFAGNMFADTDDAHARKLADIIASTTPRGIIAALQGMKIRPQREVILKFAGFPVLFIWGKKDKLLNYADMLPQAEAPADKEILLLENAGHMGFYEAPEETLQALKKFANRCFKTPGRQAAVRARPHTEKP